MTKQQRADIVSARCKAENARDAAEKAVRQAQFALDYAKDCLVLLDRITSEVLDDA